MYQPSSLALPCALLSLVLAPGVMATVSPMRGECLLARGVEFAAASACGDAELISRCLASLPEALTLSVVEQCYLDAGCSQEDSAIEAGSALKQCEDGVEGAELRRGLANMPVVTNAPAFRPRQDTTSIAFENSVVCSTTTTVTISTCTPVTLSDKTTSSCFQTPKPTLVCDSNNVCMKDKMGIDICMLRQNSLTTDGLIITIFLGLVVAVGLSTMIFLCCKDKRTEKRRKAQQEAAEILKSNTHAARQAAHPPTVPTGAPGPDPFADANRH